VGCFLRRGRPRPRWLDLAALFYPPLYAAILQTFQLGSRDSNPDFPGNNRARYHYNTPQSLRAPSGIRTRTACVGSRQATLILMGAPRSTDGGNRTHNCLIKSQVLCQLSYVSNFAVVREGVAPTASGVSDRRAPVTPPDQTLPSSCHPLSSLGGTNEKGPGVARTPGPCSSQGSPKCHGRGGRDGRVFAHWQAIPHFANRLGPRTDISNLFGCVPRLLSHRPASSLCTLTRRSRAG
jgi:hypothetical protein